MGSPVSELRLPSLRSTVRVRARTSATISLAIVLPVEPVIPTTRTAERLRHQAASSCNAAEGVRHLHQRHVRPVWQRDRSLDQGDGGSVGRRLAHEGVAIHPLTPQRHEQAAWRDVPRIDGGGGEVGDGRGSEEAATGGGHEVIETDRWWHSASCDWVGRV